MKRSRGRALNANYAALLDHYGLRSTHINRRKSHENGVAEHAHYRLKDAVDQALILRGSRDFHTADDYAGFFREMVDRRNHLVRGKLEQEMLCLRSLPPASMPEYVNYRSKRIASIVATTFTVISSATTTRLRCRLSTNGMTL